MPVVFFTTLMHWTRLLIYSIHTKLKNVEYFKLVNINIFYFYIHMCKVEHFTKMGLELTSNKLKFYLQNNEKY